MVLIELLRAPLLHTYVIERCSVEVEVVEVALISNSWQIVAVLDFGFFVACSCISCIDFVNVATSSRWVFFAKRLLRL
jgi:hypothetical protein